MMNKALSEKALNAVKNFKTVYANGMFGSPLSESIIAQKTRQLPNWYTLDRQANLRSLIGKGYFGFDCVCFVKALLWGWCGDSTKVYGGAVYESNGVPDIDEGTMLKKCSDVSADFSDIMPGEYLWLQGHCGIYAGDGLAVECTPKWENGVQITAVANMGGKYGYNNRTWTVHGRLPYVTYETSQQSTPSVPAGNRISVSLDLLRRGDRGAQVRTVQRILQSMGYYTIAIDESFGPGTDQAVRSYQRDMMLEADGIVGENTWTRLLRD